MNINYQFNATVSKPSHNEPLIAITPYHHVETLSKQHLLLSHTKNQHSLVLAIYLSNIIEILKTFRSLPEHIKEIAHFMGLNHSATTDIKNVIQQLQENGFIISAEEVLKQSLTGENYQPLQTPPIVVVRTAGRVSMLKRFLQSAVDNEFRYNARYEYLIIDDSTPELAEANAINIKNSAINAKHIDRTVQQELLNKWLDEFPQHSEAIQFLLGNHPLHELSPTYGRTWNWGILLSAGKPVVYLDDDCLLESYLPPIETQPQVALGRASNEATFLKKEKPLNQQLQTTNIDPIAKLAEGLGLTPKQLSLNISSFKDADCDVLTKLSNANIKMTYPAVAGDPGSESPIWLYYMRGESAKRFWGQTEEEYRQNKIERFNWVGDKQSHLSFGGSYSVVARAFDNRQLLPPTLPIFRDEDALFTNLIHYLYPESASLSLPWAIAHLPEIERNWKTNASVKPDSFDLMRAFDDYIDSPSAVQGKLSAKEQLLGLSKQLNNSLTTVDHEVIIRWMYENQQAMRASKVKALNHTLEDSPNAPDYWKKDILHFIQTSVGANQSLNFTNETNADEVIEILKLFAESLSVWHTLWEDCKTNDSL